LPAASFLCGDDADAKRVVRPLLEALPATVVDAGPLENARYVEPAGFLLVRLAYGLGLGSRISLSLLRGRSITFLLCLPQSKERLS
jgi:predicted dinucleotide-binding enzyme